jgi:hypothetical protein
MTRSVPLLAAACALAAVEPLAGQTFVNPTLTPVDGDQTAPIRSNARALTGILPGPARTDTLLIHAPLAMTTSRAAALVDYWQSHAEWVRANPEEFRLAVQRTRNAPDSARARVAENDSAYVAVELAATARNPLDARRAREVVPVQMQQTRIREIQRELSDRYDRAVAQNRGWPIIIFATGTASDALGDSRDGDEAGRSPITTGSLGATVETDVSRWTARVSVISSDAVAPSDFGPLILTPGSGASLSSGVLDWRGLGRSDWPNHIYGTASRIHLEGGTTTEPTRVRATIIGAGALWARDIFNGALVESTSASLTIEFGAGLRWMSGDAARDSTFGPVFRDRRAFAIGPEAGFAFSFGRVTAAAQLYHLFNSGDDIPGLGGLQMVAGMSVTGEFLSARLPHRDRGP